MSEKIGSVTAALKPAVTAVLEPAVGNDKVRRYE